MKYLLSILVLAIVITCKESKPETTISTKINLDTTNQASTESPPKKVISSSCDPTIGPATTTMKNYFVFKVNSFNPTDNSCWKALKSHWMDFCQNKFPCRVIYMEKEHLEHYKKDPMYPDFDMLEKYGIGEFTKFKEGFGWQLAGADTWGRKDKGYDFFED